MRSEISHPVIPQTSLWVAPPSSALFLRDRYEPQPLLPPSRIAFGTASGPTRSRESPLLLMLSVLHPNTRLDSPPRRALSRLSQQLREGKGHHHHHGAAPAAQVQLPLVPDVPALGLLRVRVQGLPVRPRLARGRGGRARQDPETLRPEVDSCERARVLQPGHGLGRPRGVQLHRLQGREEGSVVVRDSDIILNEGVVEQLRHLGESSQPEKGQDD